MAAKVVVLRISNMLLCCLGLLVLLEIHVYIMYRNDTRLLPHRRIHRGVGASGTPPPRNLASGIRGVRVPVNYPQAPLIKRLVFVLYDGYS